ncbi:hypothetical protein EJ066_04150 [Mesorhizobium sp. M9A.F.Ca.ET.002.03.1.2]|uniref:hypothetical protein n=1 Tax=Mesorhizobium sp. M9A.F.Ca.ET.002.03.1.2 TaxID=2493668 RepID=UPI000F7560D9|nr:hypothetical protein [Mesorhizobium sp. M9A.F.Ca.ET.002.03.1.2]AZN96543.1 hypothetical protein EJ066_04150 [Mesorhizobium sp. M9A.F.Ca.ET.002.03.1.2]
MRMMSPCLPDMAGSNSMTGLSLARVSNRFRRICVSVSNLFPMVNASGPLGTDLSKWHPKQTALAAVGLANGRCQLTLSENSLFPSYEKKSTSLETNLQQSAAWGGMTRIQASRRFDPTETAGAKRKMARN